VVWIVVGFVILLKLALKTKFGRWYFDKFKLIMPVLGPVISKVAIARFTRTLGTLVSSGVPILQALTIVKETSGNVIVGNAVAKIHESVKEGETSPPLDESAVFPPWLSAWWTSGADRRPAGDAHEDRGHYEDEVDNAVSAMTSLSNRS